MIVQKGYFCDVAVLAEGWHIIVWHSFVNVSEISTAGVYLAIFGHTNKGMLHSANEPDSFVSYLFLLQQKLFSFVLLYHKSAKGYCLSMNGRVWAQTAMHLFWLAGHASNFQGRNGCQADNLTVKGAS